MRLQQNYRAHAVYAALVVQRKEIGEAQVATRRLDDAVAPLSAI